jgi:type II secretory ATPase GspE/PulE/Tfp pilus assembly ATPase PilB-like protein
MSSKPPLSTPPPVAWANAWPLPSWLVATPVEVAGHAVKLVLADGTRHEGVLRQALLRHHQLTLNWAEKPAQVIPWDQVTSVTLLAPLVLQAPGDGAAQAKSLLDRQIARQLLPFHLRLSGRHGQGHVTGHTMGYLAASYGLFLYVEQSDGRFSAEWFSSNALDFVQLGSQLWETAPGKSFESSNPAPLQAQDEPNPLLPAVLAPAAADPLPPTLPAVTNLAELLFVMDYLRARPAQPVKRIILDLGYLSEAAFASRGPSAEASGYLLGNLLQEGLLTPEQSHRVLSCLASLPEVDLAHFEMQGDAGLMSLNDARRYKVCPLGATKDSFFVASSTPTEQELVLLLSSLLNRQVQLVWASAQAIDDRLGVLSRQARHAAPGSTPAFRPDSLPVKPVATWSNSKSAAAVATAESRPEAANIDSLLHKVVAEAASEPSGGQAVDIIESSSFVMLVNRMIQDAQALNASDIHIETNPGQLMTRIRFRRDGDLEPYLDLPASLRAALISRIKVMARLDISERRRPQDGKINFAEFGGGKLELRVAVLPTHDGLEDVVMRLLASSKPIPLAKLGLQPRDEKKVLLMAARSFGLILAVGPTGSGKTTTLHSLLKEVNTDLRKIWTAEDPIEITQEGLRQVQVNPKIGVTFASAMRAFLRADPDIIMIGEIRDEETAKIAIEGSLTGHLVLSTLHTNNASESVVRLLDLGMDPMNFADSLVGIVAQRLVRALCPKCALPQPVSAEALEKLVAEYIEGAPLDADEGRRRLLSAAGVGTPDALVVKKAVGCPNCGGKGYKGRMGIYEVLQNNATLRDLIQRRARPTEVFEAACRMGMRSLRHDALEKMVQGKIDLAQARVAYG